jgi:photosystem II stability/assembly factor-like uncharacterized protein
MSYPYGVTGFPVEGEVYADVKFLTKASGEWETVSIDRVTGVTTPSVVVANDNDLFMVVCERGDDSAAIYVSYDAGETWEEIEEHDLEIDRPVAFYGVNGTWCLVSHACDYIYTSIDGITWSANEGPGFFSWPNNQTHVTVSNGRVHVVGGNSSNTNIVYAYTDDFGVTWSELQTVLPTG